MKAEGLNPDLISTPNAPAPPGASSSTKTDDNSSESDND